MLVGGFGGLGGTVDEVGCASGVGGGGTAGAEESLSAVLHPARAMTVNAIAARPVAPFRLTFDMVRSSHRGCACKVLVAARITAAVAGGRLSLVVHE